MQLGKGGLCHIAEAFLSHQALRVPGGPRGWGEDEGACQELQEQVPAFSLDPVS